MLSCNVWEGTASYDMCASSAALIAAKSSLRIFHQVCRTPMTVLTT